MQVTVENVSSVQKILRVEIPEDRVKKELDTAYNDLKKTAKVKGFRPGKAPRSVLERHYGKDVNADVTSKLIQGTFMDAVKESNLEIIGNPDIDSPELTFPGTYTYNATVDINPELDDIDYKGLRLTKSIYSVDEEMVDNQLKMLQKNMAKMEPITEDRAAQAGDFLVMDYEGFKDGKPYGPTQKTENFTMKLGDGSVVKEFHEDIVGMKPGDNKEISAKLPEDHVNKDLAGQSLVFQVKLNEIREEILPPIDDELATKLGKFENLESLTASIRDNLQSGYDKRTEQELNEQIFTDLIEKTDFEVPETLINYELDQIISDAERSFAQQNLSFEALGLSKDIMREKYRETAEKQARRHIILSKIVRQENLELTEEETDNGIREMAETYQQPFEELKKYFTAQPDRLSFFKETLLEKKAIKLIIDNSEIEEVVPEKETDASDSE